MQIEGNLSQSRKRIPLIIIGLAIVGCKKVDYLRLDYNELLRTPIRGEVESIVVDKQRVDEIVLNVRNGSKRISFPVYSYWLEPKISGQFDCQQIETGYLCLQEFPNQHDSLFKEGSADVFEVRQDMSNKKKLLKAVEARMALDGLAAMKAEKDRRDSIDSHKYPGR